MVSTIKGCFSRDFKKFWTSENKEEDKKPQFEEIQMEDDNLKGNKEEKIPKRIDNETSFNSKDLSSSDEEIPKQKVRTSFLSNDSREGLEDYDEFPDELESPGGKTEEEENTESDGKVKPYTKSDWEKILEYGDLENTSTTEMLISLRHGIPFELRPRIWEFLTNTPRSQKHLYSEGLYKKLAASKCACEGPIKTDLHRTFSANPFFKYKKYGGEQTLMRVLRAYANFDVDVGYTQGMNFVAAALLIILHPETYQNQQSKYFEKYNETYEEKTFWMLVHLLQEKNWRIIFKDGTPKLLEMMKYFDKELSIRAPEIHDRITDTNLSVSILFSEMFITLLLMNAPLMIGKRIIDVFLIEGEKIIFKLLINALILSKEQILSCADDGELNTYIRKEMFDSLCEKYKKQLHVLFPLADEDNDQLF